MRIDEDKIFGAYMESLITEKKKGLPPWLKNKKEDKDEDKKDEKKGGKKKKSLPPWLKGKKKKIKESVVTEDHESFSNQILSMSVSDLLSTLEGDETGLYQALEKYLSEYDGAEPESADMDGMESDNTDEVHAGPTDLG